MSNFRKSLISKCIGDASTFEADSSSLNEVLNGNGDVDLFQLRSYVWMHIIPANNRIQLYKQLLGVTNYHKETGDVIDKHRSDETNYLLRCLVTIHDFSGSYSGSNPLPSTKDIVKMLLLSRGVLRDYSGEHSQKLTSDPNAVAMLQVARRVNTLCPTDWSTVFHLTRGIVKILEEAWADESLLRDAVTQVKDFSQKRFLAANISISDSFWDWCDITSWLICGMCSVLESDKAIFCILDKVCTGQMVVHFLKTVAVEYICASGRILSKPRKIDPTRTSVLHQEEEELLVKRAIELACKDLKGSAARIERVRYTVS